MWNMHFRVKFFEFIWDFVGQEFQIRSCTIYCVFVVKIPINWLYNVLLFFADGCLLSNFYCFSYFGPRKAIVTHEFPYYP
mgnify:FL=1